MPGYLVEKLVKKFGPTVALDGISFEMAEGEFVVVLGPTGAGKTTLLRTIAGLETPDSGDIRESSKGDGQGSRSILPAGPAARDISMVFQNFSLYPRLSVYDNLAFPLRPRWRKISRAEIDRRVRWAADLLGITQKLKQFPTELSGGQQQRVAIGRAIVREPKLFLFDEPLASLDAKLREQMAVEIHRLQRRLHTTMLYVTHDQNEAMSLADRIIVLDGGRILQASSPEEIYAKPASPRVARMLGNPPINLLESEKARALGLDIDTDVLVGIRPEDIAIVPEASGNGRAKVVEHLGPVSMVLFEVNQMELRAIAPASIELQPGDALCFEVNAGRLLKWPKK